MSETLTFAVCYGYGATGIMVPVSLSVGGRTIRVLPNLDTGASYCLFERTHGEALGLNIEDGAPVAIRLAKGDPFTVFGHDVRLQCFEWEYDTTVYFAADEEFKRNVLGRIGWMPQFRFAIIEHDAVLHLSHYDDE